MPTRLATRSDPQLLGRILRNLVSNAIKYTDRGRVLIGCRRRGDRVRIEVWDTGCGIPADQQRQIFWEFVQVKERGRSRSRLGLGLAIVDRLAKLLGHSVEIRSWPGRGSVFAVDMALERSPSAASSTVPTAVVPDAIFAGKLIAILEDDPAITEALTGLLRAWGASPVAASDDCALLRALSGRIPDAVIADRDLGQGGDGFAALSRLEATLGVSLPALVLTGDYDVRDPERVNEAGRRVLHKPVWPAVLHAVLRFELSRLWPRPDPALFRGKQKLHPVAHAQRPHDGGDVDLYGALACPNSIGDLLVGMPVGDQRQDFTLPWRENTAAIARCGRLHERLAAAGQQFARHINAASQHKPERLKDDGSRRRFRKIAGSAGFRTNRQLPRRPTAP
jgi:CheY-like chemotaxis protein/anti-sigma regulatory factor (Ser/Thr protein kinase)